MTGHPAGVRTRLSIMMFLQFFIWGAWYTSIAVYMTAEGMADLTHWPFTVNPLAAIVAPFFLGLVADRYLATEKILGVLHLLGGVILLVVPSTSGTPVVFILLLLLYNLCYMPTLGLTNSLAFHNIENQGAFVKRTDIRTAVSVPLVGPLARSPSWGIIVPDRQGRIFQLLANRHVIHHPEVRALRAGEWSEHSS